jgi:hypothetical protein
MTIATTPHRRRVPTRSDLAEQLTFSGRSVYGLAGSPGASPRRAGSLPAARRVRRDNLRARRGPVGPEPRHPDGPRPRRSTTGGV